jgi:hypothetical protein
MGCAVTAAWEYKTLQVGVSIHDPRPGSVTEHPINCRLQALGSAGWQLVSTALTSDPAFVLLFFRRAVEREVAPLPTDAMPKKAAGVALGN